MSEQIKDGGPAFPDPGRAQSAKQREVLTATGITMRDYFAAAALQGLCASMTDARFSEIRDLIAGGMNEATVCYLLADAMLRAREA